MSPNSINDILQIYGIELKFWVPIDQMLNNYGPLSSMKTSWYHRWTSPDCAHFSQFVNGFEAMIDRLREQLSKLLIIENLERAAGRDFAYGRRVESVVVIAVTRLNEYSRVR